MPAAACSNGKAGSHVAVVRLFALELDAHFIAAPPDDRAFVLIAAGNLQQAKAIGHLVWLVDMQARAAVRQIEDDARDCRFPIAGEDRRDAHIASPLLPPVLIVVLCHVHPVTVDFISSR